MISKANPPTKFDLAQKVRVFNAQIEFVDFEVRGAALSRKTVPIPSDLMGFAKDPKVQSLLRSSFQLIEKDAELSGESVTRLRKAIAHRYLKVLPNYGTVVLRRDKLRFERAVKGLRWFIKGFARTTKRTPSGSHRQKSRGRGVHASAQRHKEPAQTMEVVSWQRSK